MVRHKIRNSLGVIRFVSIGAKGESLILCAGCRRRCVAAKKDSNHDGSLSKEEYLLGEADAEVAVKDFDKYNKNKDRFLSSCELAELLGL